MFVRPQSGRARETTVVASASTTRRTDRRSGDFRATPRRGADDAGGSYPLATAPGGHHRGRGLAGLPPRQLARPATTSAGSARRSRECRRAGARELGDRLLAECTQRASAGDVRRIVAGVDVHADACMSRPASGLARSRCPATRFAANSRARLPAPPMPTKCTGRGRLVEEASKRFPGEAAMARAIRRGPDGRAPRARDRASKRTGS